MELQTKVEIPKYDFKINYKDKCMFIGSCFAENIGEKFLKSKIPTVINPTGIHYNPMSILNSLEKIVNNQEINEEDLFFANGRWNHDDFHSKFSDITEEKTLNKINSAIETTHIFLQKTDYLFITFGTAIVFKRKNNNNIVSNCHKQDAKIFDRYLLKYTEMIDKWEILIEKIMKFNPNLKIIFTVSPIRHVKNGAIENMRSKATLILLINELLINEILEMRKHENLFYFPVYEVVNDELRDYRFYADDMQHISDFAIKYIWEIFQENFFNKKTIKYITEITKINLALEHKAFNPESAEYQAFHNKINEKLKDFENEYL